MLNAFLSLWRVDLLVWSELVLLGVIAIGTVITLCQSRPTQKQIIIGSLGALASTAMIFADNIIVFSVAFAITLSIGSFVLNKTYQAMSKKHKIIHASLSSLSLLLFIASSLITERFGLISLGLSFIFSLPIFLAKTRVSSFFATVVPVILFINLLRFKQNTDLALLDEGIYTEKLFLWFGVVIIFGIALKFIVKKGRVQLLSLSGLEHIGITAFMVGAGPAGIIPALFHLGGQAVGHSGLWYATRNVETLRSNSTIKWLTIVLFASILAAPFSVTFISELIGIGYSLQSNLVLGLLAFLAIIIFTISIVRAIMKLLVASTTTTEPAPTTKHEKILITVLVVHVLAMFGAGTYLLTQQGIQFAVSVAQTVSAL